MSVSKLPGKRSRPGRNLRLEFRTPAVGVAAEAVTKLPAGITVGDMTESPAAKVIKELQAAIADINAIRKYAKMPERGSGMPAGFYNWRKAFAGASRPQSDSQSKRMTSMWWLNFTG